MRTSDQAFPIAHLLRGALAPLLRAALLAVLLVFCTSARAAGFSGNARIEISDGGSLSWNPTTNALTVSCWFKLAIPTGTNLTENMTILVNRRTGDDNSAHAYQVRFNIYTGNVEFTTRGASGAYTGTLIERPYLERWYHVAVVRSADTFSGYLDGRPVFSASPPGIGSSATTDGVSVGGWGAGRYLFGEVQEVAVYQRALSQVLIVQNMFANQPVIPELSGYYKLGFSTNSADNLRNFASTNPGPGTVVGSGRVEFEESNQAGEQSAFDSRRNGGRDAQAPLSGAFAWEHTLLSRPTPGITFNFPVSYSSANAFGGFKLGDTDPYAAGPLGAGWRHAFETKVLPAQTFAPLSDTDTLGLMLWNGAIETWDYDYDTGTYRTRDKEYKGELTFPTLSTCQWITPERTIYTFKAPDRGNNYVMRGRLISIRDFNTNTVELRWNETIGVITQVVDTVRGVYDFNYNASGLLTSLAFTNGPSAWQLNFTYDPTNRLTSTSVTNTSGLYTNVPTRWQFAYNTNGLLERITDPRGFSDTFVQYDQYGRQTNQVDALNRTNRTEYGVPGKRQIRRTDAGGFAWVETFDRKHHLLASTDPLGNTTTNTYDLAGNRISLTEPLGNRTLFAYDERSNLVARTNALGEVTRAIYHPFFNKPIADINALGWTNYYDLDAGGNLLRAYDNLGTLSSATYSTNGLRLTATDANGNTSRFTYDTNGFPIAVTDAASNTTASAVNELGWVLSQTNALGRVTTMDYNLNGKVVRTVDPLGRVTQQVWDGNDNLLFATDAKGATNFFFYDAENQLTQRVDRAGFTNLLRYTYSGQVAVTTDALGISSTNFYDAARRPVGNVDALGNTTSNLYNANNQLITKIDELGRRWSFTRDPLNRVIAETDPLGNTRQTSFDAAGRVRQVISARGFPESNLYDGRGRLTRWTDADGSVWTYLYDGNANITKITDALGGDYRMTYGPRNERLTETNQDGDTWLYRYNVLLQLDNQTDPRGLIRTNRYDAANQLTNVLFSTGRSDTFVLDLNGNRIEMTRLYLNTDPVTLRFNYDSLDRPTNQFDSVTFLNVGYEWDGRGQLTRLIYPGGNGGRPLEKTYDLLGRLTNQVFRFGPGQSFTNMLQYDRADRLVQHIYPNGVTRTNGFDDAGRLSGMAYITNAAPFLRWQFGYDNDGNRTLSAEQGTADFPLPPLTDERAAHTPAGKLIHRQLTSLTATNTPLNTVTQLFRYDVSGNLTNQTGGGPTLQFEYDEDNRVTKLTWSDSGTTVVIENLYDALGRRVQRRRNGQTTRYVLDLSGSMENILCEQLIASGTVNCYVHAGTLSYKVDQTGQASFYHEDASANVVAMTSAAQQVTQLKAYTPYGRTLAGSDGEQFNFVGSLGVMEDVPGLHFMRARYYSSEFAAFISRDPYKPIGPGWQPTLYRYSGLNPVRMVDATGEDGWEVLKAAGEFVITALAVVVSAEAPPVEIPVVGSFLLATANLAHEARKYVEEHPLTRRPEFDYESQAKSYQKKREMEILGRKEKLSPVTEQTTANQLPTKVLTKEGSLLTPQDTHKTTSTMQIQKVQSQKPVNYQLQTQPHYGPGNYSNIYKGSPIIQGDIVPAKKVVPTGKKKSKGK